MGRERLTDAQISEFTRVAYYYYKEGNTQEQIAKRMNMSRQRVNRILSDCLEHGIVQISINASTSTKLLELESALKEKYGLQDIRVVDQGIENNIYHNLGLAAGKYLASILRDGDTVGVTRGKTLAAMAEQIPIVHKKNITVVQLLGSRNHEPQNTAANEIVHVISNRLGAKSYMLFVPFFVNSPELKLSLQKEPSFADTYQVIKSCTIAVVGIGTRENTYLRYSLSNANIKDIICLQKGQKLAGEVGSHMFDQDGKLIKNQYWNRIIAVELEDYLKIPMRIGVAGQPEKAEAIRAAILGNYINVLITDTATAALLCEL